MTNLDATRCCGNCAGINAIAHCKACPCHTEAKESWSDHVKKLPDEVRVGLAEYVAQSFLDGVEEGRKKERDRAYKFPSWFNVALKEEFYDMWACFNRDAMDYFGNDMTHMNHKKVEGKDLIGKEGHEGIYFHKSANIGWVYDGRDVHHVYNATPITHLQEKNNQN